MNVEVAGRTLTSAAEIEDTLRRDARGGPLRPQDTHPADAWSAAMRDPGAAAAIGEVLRAMVAAEPDPDVLGMVTHLGTGVPGFDAAAATRVLDGPAVPAARGVGFPTLEEDLRFAARTVSDASVVARLGASGGAVDRLRLALDAPTPALIDALAAAAKGDVPVALVTRVALALLRELPDLLVPAAKIVAGMSPEHRATFREKTAKFAPEALKAVEAALG